MARPVLRLKPRTRPEGAQPCPRCEGWLGYRIATDTNHCHLCGYEEAVPVEPTPVAVREFDYPEFWTKGQLLNNRKNGDAYIVTALGEEFDPQHPERSMHFSSSFDCQAFISWWYNRDSHDPRAG